MFNLDFINITITKSYFCLKCESTRVLYHYKTMEIMELCLFFQLQSEHHFNISVIIGRSGRTLHDEAKPDDSFHWSTRVRAGSDVTVNIPL